MLDPGLQHERTALAWDRTGLALIITGALLVRAGAPPYDDLRHLPGYLAIGFGAVLFWWAARRYEIRRHALRGGASVVRPGLVRVIGITTIALGLLAMTLIVLR